MEFLYGDLPLIICGAAGILLLLTEAFMPGFGVAGILGIVLEIMAVYSAWLTHGTTFALIMTLAVILLIILTVYFSYRSATRGRLSKGPLVLSDEEAPRPEIAAESLRAYQGRKGEAVTPLRPGGMIEVDGVRLSAASAGDLIPKGTKVLVTGAEGDHVTVRPE